MSDNKNKTDDFFNTLEKDQVVNDPFAAQEIAFRDASGKLKILKEGQVLDLSEEDKEDKVEDQPQNTSIGTKVSTPVLQIDSDVEDIIKGTGIKFNDELIAKRFANIVVSVLRGARNRVQAREIFVKPMEEGGMGFDDRAVDNVLKVIKEKSINSQDVIRDGMNSNLSNNLQQEVDQLLKVPARKTYDENQSFTYEQDLIPKDESATVPEKDIKQIVDTPLKTVVASPIIKPKPVKASPEPINMPRPITGPDPYRPTIQDVKFEPRLTGPIEEIRTMTLSDFRKLGDNPVGAVHKILEKINLLEEESFTSKTLGIKAWKDSLINRQYIDLGEESMESKKSMADVIAQRQATGENVLTTQEVEAVIELNKLLRY